MDEARSNFDRYLWNVSEDRHSCFIHMAIVPFIFAVACTAKVIRIMALMVKATSRKIVIRFSVSQSVLLVTPVTIAPHPLNRALGLEEGYLDVS